MIFRNLDSGLSKLKDVKSTDTTIGTWIDGKPLVRAIFGPYDHAGNARKEIDISGDLIPISVRGWINAPANATGTTRHINVPSGFHSPSNNDAYFYVAVNPGKLVSLAGNTYNNSGNQFYIELIYVYVGS